MEKMECQELRGEVERGNRLTHPRHRYVEWYCLDRGIDFLYHLFSFTTFYSPLPPSTLLNHLLFSSATFYSPPPPILLYPLCYVKLSIMLIFIILITFNIYNI